MENAIELKPLLKTLGVEYIEYPEYSVELMDRDSFLKTLNDQEINEISNLAKLYSKNLFQAKKPQTEVKFLGVDVGYGLFASEDISKGKYIGEYTGIVRPLSRSWFLFKRSHYPTDYAWNFPGFSLKGKSLEIDSRKKGNETRFINHSFEPNIKDNFTTIPPSENQKERSAIFFTSLIDIKKGEQLLVNYGEDYWIGGKRELILL